MPGPTVTAAKEPLQTPSHRADVQEGRAHGHPIVLLCSPCLGAPQPSKENMGVGTGVSPSSSCPQGQSPRVEGTQICYLHVFVDLCACGCDFSQTLSLPFLGQLAIAGQYGGAHEALSWPRPHLNATEVAGLGPPGPKRPWQSHQSSQTLTPERAKASTCCRDRAPGRRLPAGLEARGEGGNRVELVEESQGRRLLKKLLSSPHLRDSTRVVFPDPEWPNSFSLILGCRFCVGRSCWMKSPRCVS